MAASSHHGGCHCGAVRYQVDLDLDTEAINCNCSMCGRAGTLLMFVPESGFKLEQGEANLTDYVFNRHVIHHLFCKTCGVRPFGFGKSPDVGEMVGVNIGCLENATPEELAAAPIRYCDGKNDNWQHPPPIVSYL